MTLDEIRELIEAATSGPWQADGDGGGSWDPDRGYARSCVDTPLSTWWSGTPISGSDMCQLAADAKLIAAARTLLPALLAAVCAAEDVYDTHPALRDWSAFRKALEAIDGLPQP